MLSYLKVLKSKNPRLSERCQTEFWTVGFLDFWISGFLDFWIFGFLDCLIFGFWPVQISTAYLVQYKCMPVYTHFLYNIKALIHVCTILNR